MDIILSDVYIREYLLSFLGIKTTSILSRISKTYFQFINANSRFIALMKCKPTNILQNPRLIDNICCKGTTQLLQWYDYRLIDDIDCELTLKSLQWYDYIFKTSYDIPYVLNKCAMNGNFELFVHFHNVHEVNDLYDENLFYKAIKGGNIDIIKYLVEHGANIRGWYNKAFQYAVDMGNLTIICYFLELGVNINACNGYITWRSAELGHLSIVKYAVEHSANINSINHALQSACEYGNMDIVKYLVEHSADINCNDQWCLRVSITNGHIDIANYLIINGANRHQIVRYRGRFMHDNIIKFCDNMDRNNEQMLYHHNNELAHLREEIALLRQENVALHKRMKSLEKNK
jgi:ankyrin repeat protein